MNNVYLLSGSNQGDRASIMQQAILLLEAEAGSVIQRSPLYETAPWGKTDQPSFLNQALQLATPLSPEQVLACIAGIERTMGRQRTEHWGQRTLDLDILFFNDAVVDTPQLTIPHPEIANRRFVLVPLCAIAPTLKHPLLGVSMATLLEQCPDSLPVTLYEMVE